MSQKKLVAFINAENEYSANIIKLADKYSCDGADGLFIYNYSGDEASREEFLLTVRKIEKQIDIPFCIGVYVDRFEDAKKALYTGASKIVIRKALMPEEDVMSEIISRFGKDKIALEIDMKADFHTAEKINEYYDMGIGTVILKHINMTQSFKDVVAGSKANILIRDGLIRNDLEELLSMENMDTVMTNYFEDKDIYKAKRALKNNGVDIDVFEALIDFSDFKLLDNGLIPVVVQDYRTNEVRSEEHTSELQSRE